jgi:hypothetical protein
MTDRHLFLRKRSFDVSDTDTLNKIMGISKETDSTINELAKQTTLETDIQLLERSIHKGFDIEEFYASWKRILECYPGQLLTSSVLANVHQLQKQAHKKFIESYTTRFSKITSQKRFALIEKEMRDLAQKYGISLSEIEPQLEGFQSHLIVPDTAYIQSQLDDLVAFSRENNLELSLEDRKELLVEYSLITRRTLEYHGIDTQDIGDKIQQIITDSLTAFVEEILQSVQIEEEDLWIKVRDFSHKLEATLQSMPNIGVPFSQDLYKRVIETMLKATLKASKLRMEFLVRLRMNELLELGEECEGPMPRVNLRENFNDIQNNFFEGLKDLQEALDELTDKYGYERTLLIPDAAEMKKIEDTEYYIRAYLDAKDFYRESYDSLEALAYSNEGEAYKAEKAKILKGIADYPGFSEEQVKTLNIFFEKWEKVLKILNRFQNLLNQGEKARFEKLMGKGYQPMASSDPFANFGYDDKIISALKNDDKLNEIVIAMYKQFPPETFN